MLNNAYMTLKELYWIGSSKDDLCGFPEDVQDVMGYALHVAQKGEKHPSAKGLKGIPAMEIVDDHDGDTYRAVYTAKIGNAVYVLHAFQKKSKKGIKTPKQDIDLIKSRLQDAKAHHKGE